MSVTFYVREYNDPSDNHVTYTIMVDGIKLIVCDLPVSIIKNIVDGTRSSYQVDTNLKIMVTRAHLTFEFMTASTDLSVTVEREKLAEEFAEIIPALPSWAV